MRISAWADEHGRDLRDDARWPDRDRTRSFHDLEDDEYAREPGGD
jgi:hypothetical protein